VKNFDIISADPAECHVNSGLLKGDLRRVLDVFACSRAKI
jgi:hypothetical protein